MALPVFVSAPAHNMTGVITLRELAGATGATVPGVWTVIWQRPDTAYHGDEVPASEPRCHSRSALRSLEILNVALLSCMFDVL